MRLTLGWNRDCDESGGTSFIMSLTEATGGASSSGREVLKPIHSFAETQVEGNETHLDFSNIESVPKSEVVLLASAWFILAFVGTIGASSYLCPL